MCSEICQFSSFLRTMSSSDKPQLFPLEREGIVENETSSSSSDQPEEKEKDKATVSDRQSEKKIREDDDGFKTPDHRIPVITQCPPAPKKPRPPPSKRKRKVSSPPGACRSLQFEAAAEVESLLRPISNDQDDTQDQKTKRARTDDDHKENPS